MAFWGWVYLVVTFGLVVFKKEDKTKERDSIMEVYRSMMGVLKLRNIHTLIVIMLIGKLGFVTNDAVTNLKLLDKGFGQANLALVVLIDFPFEISLGYYAGKWSAEYTPLQLWCWAFAARLLAAVFAQITIMIYPSNPVPTWYMIVVILEHIYSTFMNTVMFVAGSAFFARIADPAIGGTYMTMLATYVKLTQNSRDPANRQRCLVSPISVAHSPKSSSSSSLICLRSPPANLIQILPRSSQLIRPYHPSPLHSPAPWKLRSTVVWMEVELVIWSEMVSTTPTSSLS